MALDALTASTPGQAAAWPDGSPSPALGTNADVLAFLQAMVAAQTSADAGDDAEDAPAPGPDGATTVLTGISPACAVVPPWHPSSPATLRSDNHDPRSSPPAVPADGDTEETIDVRPLLTDAVRRAADALRPQRVASSPTLAEASVEPTPSAADSAGVDETDADAQAAAFLVNAVIALPLPLAPLDVPAAVSTTEASVADIAPERTVTRTAAPTGPGVEAPEAPHVVPASLIVGDDLDMGTLALAGTGPTNDGGGTTPTSDRPGRQPAAEAMLDPVASTPPSAASRLTSLNNQAARQADDQTPAAKAEVAPEGRRSPTLPRRPTLANTIEAGGVSEARVDPAAVPDVPAASPEVRAFVQALQARDLVRPTVSGQVATALTAMPTDNLQAPDEFALAGDPAAAWAAAGARAVAAQIRESATAEVRERVNAATTFRLRPEDVASAVLPDTSPARFDMFALRAQMTHATLAPLLADMQAAARDGQGSGADDRSSLFRSPRPLTLATPRGEAGLVQFASMALPAFDAAAEPTSATPRLPNEAAVAASLVRSMQWQYRNGVGSAVVNLDPGYLGNVTVALQIERGVVIATLHAASAEVRGWMQANEALLRQGLSDQGLSLDRLVVAEDEPADQPPPRQSGREQSSGQEEQPPRPRRTPPREDTAVFDVIV